MRDGDAQLPQYPFGRGGQRWCAVWGVILLYHAKTFEQLFDPLFAILSVKHDKIGARSALFVERVQHDP